MIKKDLLAIVFALNKYNHFTFAHHVIAQPNPKALETIASGQLWKSPKRLQVMKLCLQKYDITVKYKGTEMVAFIPDTHSRTYLPMYLPRRTTYRINPLLHKDLVT